MTSKAGKHKTQWQIDAREYCQMQGLTKESQLIDDMDWPETWHLERDGDINHKPSWWFLPRAIIGNYIIMWQKHGKGWPSTASWQNLDMSAECYKWAAYLYLITPEGQAWFYRNDKPDWLWLEDE